MVKLDQRESDDKDKNEADRRRQRERARERRRSELSNETKGRKNKQTFLLSPLLSVSVLLVAAPFSSESLKKKRTPTPLLKLPEIYIQLCSVCLCSSSGV